VRQVLGIVTVLAMLGWCHPSAATAQAIGTMQVEARVTPAENEWSSLRAAQELAATGAAASAVAGSSPTASLRLALPLAEIRWIPSSTAEHGDIRSALISIQYLRN
jgi:hypothetical protein